METSKRYRSYTTLGWMVSLAGCALWSYGYFVGAPGSILNWSTFSPHWIADYLPNWQAETGLLLTLVASLPIYYAQVKTSRREE